MRISLRPFAAALLTSTFFAAGCASSSTSPPADSLTLRAEADSPATSVGLVMTNRSADRLGYNLCPSTVERRTGDAWRTLPSERVCTMELRTMEPGGQATYTLRLEEPLAAGQYRVKASVERMERGTRLAVYSNTFTVR